MGSHVQAAAARQQAELEKLKKTLSERDQQLKRQKTESERLQSQLAHEMGAPRLDGGAGGGGSRVQVAGGGGGGANRAITSDAVKSALQAIGPPPGGTLDQILHVVSHIEKLQAKLGDSRACPWYGFEGKCRHAGKNECPRCPSGVLLSPAILRGIEPLLSTSMAKRLSPPTEKNPQPGDGSAWKPGKGGPSKGPPSGGDGRSAGSGGDG